MLQDYDDLQRCSRRCAASLHELQPGEPYFSVLRVEGARVQRYDYCEREWAGPPLDALGWWRSCLPEVDRRQPPATPTDVLLNFLQDLEGKPHLADQRYVLALLLVRRRVLRLEEETLADSQAGKLVLIHPLDDRRFEVDVREPTSQRMREIQEDLSRLLFSDAAHAAANAGKDAACEDPS